MKGDQMVSSGATGDAPGVTSVGVAQHCDIYVGGPVQRHEEEEEGGHLNLSTGGTC